MKTLRYSLAGLLAAAAVAIAAGPPPVKPPRPVDKESLNDQLDYLFLASDRPVTIRLHLRLGDKPYAQAWSAWMDKLFDWFDKDHDGYLSAAEVARLPQPNSLSFHLQGSIGGFFGNQTIPLATLDTDKDGKVSRAEFRDYYRKFALGALRFNQSNYQANEAEKVNKAIYSRLNKKKDGKLTRDDAARFPDLLTKLDENEDELLAVSEINTRADGGYYGFVEASPSGGVPPRMTVNYGLIDTKATPPGDLVKKLINAYDRDKDGKLSEKEIGLGKAEFAALDKNKDGKLDAAELAAFFARPPDLTLRARVGALGATNTVVSGLGKLFGQKKPTAADRAEVLTPAKRPLAKAVKRLNGDNLALSLGDARIAVHVNQGQIGYYQGTKQFYLRQFDSIANKKESIDRKQVMGDYYLQQMFTQADQNADNKLTKKELTAWLDLLAEGGGTFVNLSLSDEGRSLFKVVDTNGDGQLSIRELRTAWDRIKPLCKDKDKSHLKTADLPRALTVTMQQGYNNFGGPRFVAFGPGGNQNMLAGVKPGQAPLWFRKMDRNNDGDISPKEWLGTEEEFREIDADGDGLISAEEARQFEEKRRKKEEAAKKEEATKKEDKPPQEKGDPKKQ